ncbi:aminoacyl-tRNA deacylase [Amycolatopsis sp. NBRC 101858]|jgi:prolyl-tRNA editing enzyme YbaK/EbsC (Cys-tRNA(Pro) deacylase)|uniref:YbaK/EbsC family protein n=1 Tax=Amycolatopsis TaxID=1813 RepID=UPI0024A30AC2|nr:MULTISPECIES: YbaK/EbsC family protein [unclassified Amycolatopsis]GLY42542.1 aminoacyl-tRNA deacylase [Amycolatopsis sp. NBRC 101858]
MSSLDHPAVAKVAAALAEAGQHAAAEGIRVLPAEVRTAAQAAEALGVPVGAIANSLIFRLGSDKKALLALTSGAHRADPATLERLAGAGIGKADADFVRAHTGQPIGGVAPTGHPGPLPTLVDTALRAHDVVWAAAGHPKTVYPTTFAELVALTGGTPGALSGAEEDGQP